MSEATDVRRASGGPPSRDIGFARLTLRIVAAVVLVFIGTAAFWFLASRISGGVWRVLIASALGLIVAAFGVGYFRQFNNFPAEPTPEDVPAELGLVYLCEMCGMELSVIRIAKEKAPRHCGEEMILTRRG